MSQETPISEIAKAVQPAEPAQEATHPALPEDPAKDPAEDPAEELSQATEVIDEAELQDAGLDLEPSGQDIRYPA
jgi:hypothetical protein